MTHSPFLHVWPVVQHTSPHGSADPDPVEGQPQWSPLHVAGAGVQHITPIDPHGAHVWLEQQVSPQSTPRSEPQHAPAGLASLLTHVAVPVHPPPPHATVEPGGGVAAWPTLHVFSLQAEHAMPGGAQ